MLKFFRKIRRDLLDEGNLKRSFARIVDTHLEKRKCRKTKVPNDKII
jgi:hypothetical protein